MNMQSNCIRGEYLQEIMDKTINEIHDDLLTVFGPYATDAFITKDNMPYYTRDGLETIRSIRFDNELAMYILKVLYQAVYDQGRTVGDGTTTLAIFYTNLYKQLRKNFITSIDRNKWNITIDNLISEIKQWSTPLTKDLMYDMLYTCTQDEELSKKIYDNLGDAIMNKAFIVINKSNIDSDFNMTVHETPMFKATKQFSIFPLNDTEESTVIFHCNGMLDLAFSEIVMGLVQLQKANGDKLHIMILCNGLTDRTRNTLKDVNNKLHNIPEEVRNTLSNLSVFTLDEYRSYDPKQLEDISTIITDEVGIGGMVNSLTFESLIYQTFFSGHFSIPELTSFDHDIRIIGKLTDIMNNPYPVDIDTIEGIRIHKPLGPNATARYNELREEIDNEKSEVKKIELNRRLRTMYGQFIEVEVGSRLLKDSQRKYELILDAVLSASDAAEHGVLKGNIISIASYIIKQIVENSTESYITYDDILYYALYDTMYDLLHIYDIRDDSEPEAPNKLLYYNINRTFDAKKFTPRDFENVSDFLLHLNNTTPKSHIIEPVSVITNILRNSTVVTDLYNTKTVHLENFMQNYL